MAMVTTDWVHYCYLSCYPHAQISRSELQGNKSKARKVTWFSKYIILSTLWNMDLSSVFEEAWFPSISQDSSVNIRTGHSGLWHPAKRDTSLFPFLFHRINVIKFFNLQIIYWVATKEVIAIQKMHFFFFSIMRKVGRMEWWTISQQCQQTSR